VVLASRLGLAGALARRDPDQARAVLAAAGEDVDRLAAALRRLIRAAPVPELAAGGIAAALRAQTRQLAGVEIDDQTRRRPPIELATTVYFCCLEAIQNAVRHAGAARIRVRLWEPEGCLRASVRDDGTGFDPSRDHAGTGLRNLRERLRPWDGRLAVRSSPAGTEVQVEIPLPAPLPAPAPAPAPAAGEVAAA
jgi:signal transduction histidine kinase